MHTHLIAPSDLIPLIAARLHFKPPSSSYSLHPLNSPIARIDSGELAIVFQCTNSSQLQTLQHCMPQLVDAIAIPSPIAPSHGFITMASGSLDALNLASDILDRIAPLENGWLHLGDLGASCFLQQLWLALITPDGASPFLNWTKTENPRPLNQSDLIAYLATFIAQQQLQTQTLASLARSYLAQNPSTQPFTPHHPQITQLFADTRNSQLYSPIQQLAQFLSQL